LSNEECEPVFIWAEEELLGGGFIVSYTMGPIAPAWAGMAYPLKLSAGYFFYR